MKLSFDDLPINFWWFQVLSLFRQAGRYVLESTTPFQNASHLFKQSLLYSVSTFNRNDPVFPYLSFQRATYEMKVLVEQFLIKTDGSINLTYGQTVAAGAILWKRFAN